jgi:eukaryotic-like serine/threonine-protein kinase
VTLPAGTRLGPYEILSPLGAGGMGEVYRARDTRLGREVAVKVLPAELSADAERRTRFEQEARSASALNHPNIVTVYDIGSQEGTVYIAMELVEGASLRELLGGELLPLRKLLDIGVQMAEGLAKAHAAGIVHRDLKPENVMISRDGFLKILDFGLAKLVEASAEEVTQMPTAVEPATRPGTVLGTVGYMSPEQASGQPVDFRSDQFSFASILYEVATGRRAFQKATGVETMSAIIREDPAPIGQANPHAPPPLRWIIERCLNKSPEDRYASTRDLARELAGVRDHLSEISAATEVGVAAGFSRRSGRSPWGFAGIVGAAGLLLGAGLALLLHRPVGLEPTELRYLTYSGHDHAPAVSPDGRIIAFSSDRDGTRRIWLKQMSGGGEAPLTSGPDDFPRFSPDGAQLLFVRSEGRRSSIDRVALVGGEPRKVVDDAYEADWSPDGKEVAFLLNAAEGEQTSSFLYVLPVEAGVPRLVARVGRRGLVHPRWSPDGRSVACSEIGSGGALKSFFLIDLGTGKTREIPSGAVGALSSVAWLSRDRIVYAASESAAASVTASAGFGLLRDLATGRIRRLFWTPADPDVLDIAGPGQIVFDARSPRENLEELRVKDGRVLPGERWLTQGSSADRQPCYCPDGDWVLFSSTRSGNLDLWELSTKSGAVRRLTDDAAEDWDPGFTRDGKKIIWSSNRTGHFEIWMAEADGSGAHPVTQQKLDAENPTTTPDGKWIVFNQGSVPLLGVWKIHPDGTGATQLVAGATALPEISPDGRYVCYVTTLFLDLNGVRVVRLSDGQETSFQARLPVRSNLTGNSVGRSRWMPDGKALVMEGQDEKGNYGLFVQDFDPDRDTSASLRPFFGFDSKMAAESFGIAPDGLHLIVAAWEQSSNLMLADHVPEVFEGQERRVR